MKISKTAVAAAVAATLGTVGMVGTASAIVDGSYNMVINTTPIGTTYYGATSFKAGRDGAWNSTFTFGNLPGPMSNGMTDNGVLVSGLGTSVAGDGYAGNIGMSISGGSISVTSFNVDTIFGTAGGDFAQYVMGGLAGMTGSVTAGGSMSFTPTGRRGSINAPVMNADFNIDNFSVPGATTWQSFSTGTACASAGCINGSLFTNIGDVNADGLDDYAGVLVTGGQIGSAWGDFFGATYFETWNVRLLSSATSEVPVPAAVWLFGSGLLGLVGVARRRKA